MFRFFRKQPSIKAPDSECQMISLENLVKQEATCISNEQIGTHSIRLTLEFEHSFSASIGNGLRVAIGLTNNVVVVCTGVLSLVSEQGTPQKGIFLSNDKQHRVLTVTTTDNTTITVTCKVIQVEKHTQYVANEDGSRSSIGETIEQYRRKAPELQQYLNELKRKRDTDRLNQSV